MEELEQILVSLDGDTYRVGLLSQTPDEEGRLIGIRYHDYLGRPIQEEITFGESQIVSHRTIRMSPSEVTIYHYSSDGKIKASEYAVAGQDELTPITNHGFGSGIYGLNISPQEVASKRSNPNQPVFQIPCRRIFFIQDEDHGNSISQASKMTDRYVDYIISYIKQLYPNQTWSIQPPRTEEEPICDQHGTFGQLSQIILLMNQAEQSITPDMEIPNLNGLQILWNNVFAREQHQIMLDPNTLRMILGTYILLYLTNPGRLIPTPITYLMVTFRFDSLISTDPYDNSFTRGCVRYCPFTDISRNLLEYTTRRQRLFSP